MGAIVSHQNGSAASGKVTLTPSGKNFSTSAVDEYVLPPDEQSMRIVVTPATDDVKWKMLPSADEAREKFRYL